MPPGRSSSSTPRPGVDTARSSAIRRGPPAWPTTWPGTMHRARDAEALGDGFAARWHLDRMIAARPGDGLLRARLAQALLMDGDQRIGRDPSWPARSSWGRAIASSTGSCSGPRTSAPRAARMDALLLLDQVIAAGPGDWLVHARRAEVLAALGRTADREADLDTGHRSGGADIPFLIRLAAERSTGRTVERGRRALRPGHREGDGPV